MIELIYDQYRIRGYEGDINSPSFQSYLKLLSCMDDLENELPLKYKRWRYRKMNKRKSLRQRG